MYYHPDDDRRNYQHTVPPVALDDYEGPGDGRDQDEPADPRDEYDRDAGVSGYDATNWSF